MSSIYVPDNPGTVSFTNGSTVINGVGTLFRGMSAGGLISIPGLGEMQLAEDPASDTAAAGVVAWQGANTGPRPYQHVPRNSQATFSQKLAQLLQLLSGGNLQSLAELEIDADTLLRGVGPGAIEAVDGSNVFEFAALTLAAKKILATDASGNLIQSDLKDWAKQMLALAGAPNKLAYLDGGGSAALTDLTAKGRAILARTDNAGVLEELGVTPFWQGRITVDADESSARAALGADNAANLIQGLIDVARIPATLSPDKAFRRGNIIGTVMQSGGVPTGAMMEIGTNYLRLANGFQACWGIVVVGGSGWKTSGQTVNYAATFSATPSIQLTSNAGDPGYAGIAEARYPSGTGFLMLAPGGITDTGTSAWFGWLAIGKWF